MEKNELFLKATNKLYDLVIQKLKDEDIPSNRFNITDLGILFDKSLFEEAEWHFLKDNESNFRFVYILNLIEKIIPVYKIERDVLCINDKTIIGIQNIDRYIMKA